MNNKVLHVSMSFDDRYLTAFTVLVTSILKNNAGNPIHVHAVASGLSRQQKRKLNKLLRDNGGRMIYYKISDERVKDFYIPEDSHLTISSYYRLCIADLVPDDVEKLLYLDTDIVVNNSIAGLFDLDLGKYAVGAVTEYCTNTIRPELGITSSDMYFNSGVLLINVKQWRKQGITERAINFILANPEKLIFADQDALNAVFAGKYFRLAGKYNVIHADVPAGLTRSGYRAFVQNKVMIHYTLSNNKPWKENCKSNVRFLYFEYLQRSICRNERFELEWIYHRYRFKKQLLKARKTFNNQVDELLARVGLAKDHQRKPVL